MYSDSDILAAMEKGTIQISDFDEDRLGPNSYDVILGNWFYDVIWDCGKPIYIGPFFYDDGQEVLIPAIGTRLAMTKDVIGTFVNVVGRIKNRSTTRRTGIRVCDDAGLGDVGYHNHWTLELSSSIINRERMTTTGAAYAIPGQRIAQIVFEETKTPAKRPYNGQYNLSDWPICMVPSDFRHRIREVENEG